MSRLPVFGGGKQTFGPPGSDGGFAGGGIHKGPGFSPFRPTHKTTTHTPSKPKSPATPDRKFPDGTGAGQGEGVQTGIDIFKDVLEGELNEQQRIAKERHDEMKGVEDEFRDSINEGMDTSRLNADEIAERLRELGQENTDEIRDRIEQTEAEFEDRTAQVVQSQTLGIQRQIGNEIDNINSQIRSGAIPEAVGKQRIRELENSSMETLSNSLTNIGTAFNQQRASLQSTGTQQLQGAMNAQAQYEAGAASAIMAGEQMAMQWAGMFPALGEMMGSNPPPFVSMFAGMMTLAELAMAGFGSREGAAGINAVFGLDKEGNPTDAQVDEVEKKSGPRRIGNRSSPNFIGSSKRRRSL